MLFSDNPRVHYKKAQLAEVICQFRFPAILSIDAKEPADFQEAVRSMFPRYAIRKDQPGPKITGLGTPGAKLETPEAITNYHFISADGRWKLNLTRGFISLSTIAYPGWEEFGKRFDLPLAQFIRIYQPSFFERIGLRYVNIFSRKALDLEGEPWRELIAPPYLGILSAEDVDEASARKCAVDVEMGLDSTCRVKPRPGQNQRPRRAEGPRGQVHPGSGPLYGRPAGPPVCRRRTGDAARPLHRPVPGSDHRPFAQRLGTAVNPFCLGERTSTKKKSMLAEQHKEQLQNWKLFFSFCP